MKKEGEDRGRGVPSRPGAEEEVKKGKERQGGEEEESGQARGDEVTNPVMVRTQMKGNSNRK